MNIILRFLRISNFLRVSASLLLSEMKMIVSGLVESQRKEQNRVAVEAHTHTTGKEKKAAVQEKKAA